MSGPTTFAANDDALIARRLYPNCPTVRTGIVGTSQSGKTTFITAVVDAVNRMDRRLLGSTLGQFTHRVVRLPPLAGEGGAFPFKEYRDNLKLRAWPHKSIRGGRYAFRHALQGHSFVTRAYAATTAVNHELVDIPGERLADFAMGGRTYDAWSDALLAILSADGPARPMAADYFAALDRSPLDAAAVVTAYKRVLARYTRAGLPMVTPSTFLVSPTGAYPTGDEPLAALMDEDRLVARGVTGTDAAHEFAPLTAAARAANPPLAATFAAAFEAYRSTVCDGLWADFARCDNLLVLVDAAAVLEGGPMVYDATRHAVEQALSYLDPGHTPGTLALDALVKLVTLRHLNVAKVGRLGVVATKADAVHSENRARLLHLTEQMTSDLTTAVAMRRKLKVSTFYCAAVNATTDGATYPNVRGWVRPDDAAAAEYRELRSSEVPTHWPPESAWPAYRFAACEPPPDLDFLGDKPWPNVGMTPILDFLGLRRVGLV